MIAKIKALVQWFVQLEVQEHGHWCHYEWHKGREEKRAACPYKGYRWPCFGVLCANVERKDCYGCLKFLDENPSIKADMIEALERARKEAETAA
jgi:hypothetical protein